MQILILRYTRTTVTVLHGRLGKYLCLLCAVEGDKCMLLCAVYVCWLGLLAITEPIISLD